MTHILDTDDFFIHRIQQHCAERGLTFFLIEPLWVEQFLERLRRNELWARVMLNMHSEHHLPEEIYHRVVRLAHERQIMVIDPPDIALQAFDKARVHPKLAEAALKTPPTIIVSREKTAEFSLSDADRAALGTPFVIKPSMGYGRRGVILDATSQADLARSVSAWPSPAYLLQRKIVPRILNDSPAYFRVYFVFGSIWCCWWNCYTDRYKMVTPAENQEFGLARLYEIAGLIARIANMNFFSTEIAQTEAGEWVIIDYVNDQCHMLSQSSNPKMGVPDELVAAVARRLVEGAQQLMAHARIPSSIATPTVQMT
jgi:hypothetical protein